jgi:hypothetical protein
MPRRREPPPDATPRAAPGPVEALTAERDAALAGPRHLALAQRARPTTRTSSGGPRRRGRCWRLANEILLAKVVALADDFDLAIDRVAARATPWSRIAAIDRKLRALLESEGVTPIEALGRPFDPALHEAISHVPGSGRPEDEVVAELRRGYRIRDRVLRPALVAVSDGSGPAERPN